MKVFITGASGFIGSNLIKGLNDENLNLMLLTRDKKKLNYTNKHLILEGDLNNLKNIETEILKFNPNIVIHLAWEGIPDYSDNYSNKNLNNTINFLEFIINNTQCRKIISSGSCWEYEGQEGACKESEEITSKDPFILSKIKIFKYLKKNCIKNQIIFNWFRIFYVYGFGQKNTSIIPLIINSFIKNNYPSIKSPNNKNDFVYIDDVVDIFVQSIKKDIKSGIYNIGSGKSTKIIELCNTIGKIILDNPSYEISKRTAISNENFINFWADLDKINKAFPKLKKTSLDEGLNRMIKKIIKNDSI